jgi:hypothetical protein
VHAFISGKELEKVFFGRSTKNGIFGRSDIFFVKPNKKILLFHDALPPLHIPYEISPLLATLTSGVLYLVAAHAGRRVA